MHSESSDDEDDFTIHSRLVTAYAVRVARYKSSYIHTYIHDELVWVRWDESDRRQTQSDYTLPQNAQQ